MASVQTTAFGPCRACVAKGQDTSRPHWPSSSNGKITRGFPQRLGALPPTNVHVSGNEPGVERKSGGRKKKQEKLFAGESRDEMQKPEEPVTEAALETLRAENAALAEWAEALRRENQELERTRHRLQLEVDVLKKADEILKKSTLLSEISGDVAITPILVRSARQPPISLPGTSMQKSPTKSG